MHDGARARLAGIAGCAGDRRFVLPGAGDAGGVRERKQFPRAGAIDVQRRGNVRRFFGHRPAAGIAGISNLVVGDSASAPAGDGRGGRRVAWRVCAPAMPGGIRPRGVGAAYGGAGGLAGGRLPRTGWSAGIRQANRGAPLAGGDAQAVFTADPCPMPAMEMLIAEMLAIHFCSDHEETLGVLGELLAEVRRRVARGLGVLARRGRARLLGQPGGRFAGR